MSDAQKRQSSMRVESPIKQDMGDLKLKKKVVKKVVKKAKAITKKTKTVLTKAQETKLKNHNKHSKSHMRMMEKLILDGETFKKAHEMTVKSVGN